MGPEGPPRKKRQSAPPAAATSERPSGSADADVPVLTPETSLARASANADEIGGIAGAMRVLTEL